MQFTKGGICRVVSAAAAVLPPLLGQLSGSGLITAQGNVMGMITAFASLFSLAETLQGNGQAVNHSLAKKATPFWEEVRQHSTLQLLAQLSGACRGNLSHRWQGAALIGTSMRSLISSHPWKENSSAALAFHHVAARDPALQSFVSETLALLCADVMAGRCDNSPQEAAQRLHHPFFLSYCVWIKLTRVRGDWAPAGLRALFSPQGLITCLVPFVFSKLGTSPWFTATMYSALMVTEMVLGDAPGEPPN